MSLSMYYAAEVSADVVEVPDHAGFSYFVAAPAQADYEYYRLTGEVDYGPGVDVPIFSPYFDSYEDFDPRDLYDEYWDYFDDEAFNNSADQEIEEYLSSLEPKHRSEEFPTPEWVVAARDMHFSCKARARQRRGHTIRHRHNNSGSTHFYERFNYNEHVELKARDHWTVEVHNL